MRNPQFEKVPFRPLKHVLEVRSAVLGAGLLLAAGSAVAQDDGLFFAGPEICPQDVIDIPQILLDGMGQDPSTQQIVLEADAIDSADGNVLQLTGNAQVIQGAQAIYAEKIAYDKEAFSLEAEQDVTIYTPRGDRMELGRLSLDMETFIGDADQAEFQMADRPADVAKRRLMDSSGIRLGQEGSLELDEFDSELEPIAEAAPAKVEEVRANMRGDAEKIYMEGRDRQRLERARITSCREGQDSVYVSASELVLDHGTGIGTGTNMVVRFFGVPVFYFPKASFPINGERKTGFLFPSIGSSDSSGTVVEVPYYINIAPNQDATVNLRYLSDRGVQVMGEYRYLGEKYDGIFRGEFLPGDDIYGDDRSAFSIRHNHRFTDQWTGNVDVQDVSDIDYLDDFANSVEVTSSRFLDQRASVAYTGTIFRFNGSVVDYQNIDPDIDEDGQPYERLPRLTLAAQTPRGTLGAFQAGFDSELVNFEHPGDRIIGTRLDLTPYVSLPMQQVYGYVTPKLSLRHTSYSLDNVDPGDDDSPARTVPVFSVDAGIAFERDASWRGRPHYQTLEPRVYYVYSPEENQDDLPVFDTGESGLNNIGNFYRDSRFFGADRAGDENRITLGLTSRLIDAADGQQRLQAEIAQVFFFDDREVSTNPGSEPDTEDKSDLLAQLRGYITEKWEVGASARYDYEESETESIRLDTRYERDRRSRVEIAYWWDNDDYEQVDLDLYWPLAGKWQAKLRERYDIEEGENLSTSVSVRYDACCWAAAVTGEQRVNRDEDDETALYFTLEFKNLGRFSSSY